MTNYNLQSYASPVEWPAPPGTAEEAVQLLKKSPALFTEYCLVSLDVFRNFQYHKPQNRQTAWLSLLATETLADADAWIQIYPWLEEIYQEITMLRTRPGEVLGMYSEMIRTLDHNTLKFIVEELQQKVEEEQAAREAERMAKEAERAEKEAERAAKEKALAENEELRKRLAALEETPAT